MKHYEDLRDLIEALERFLAIKELLSDSEELEKIQNIIDELYSTIKAHL